MIAWKLTFIMIKREENKKKERRIGMFKAYRNVLKIIDELAAYFNLWIFCIVHSILMVSMVWLPSAVPHQETVCCPEVAGTTEWGKFVCERAKKVL